MSVYRGTLVGSVRSRRARVIGRTFATSALTLVAGLAATAQAQTVPTGGLPSAGEVTIGTPTGNANGGLDLTMIQTTGRAIIDWSTFNVGQFDRVIFNQPGATSATLNRVVGDTASTIAGQITSNGSVYLVNPNGIAITATGTVQAGGGFIASTLGITSTAFLNGSNVFTGAGASAAVRNAGSITASGFVALLGGIISNAGTISVPVGRVALGSGQTITLDLNGSNFLTVSVPSTATTADGVALIESAGTITGGRIELSAASAADAVRRVVNVSGTINANSATGNAGSILLSAVGPAGAVGGGIVSASGTLTAQATGTTGNGGTITLSGGTVTTDGLTASTRAAGINGATGTLTLRQQGMFTPSTANKGNLADLLTTNNVTVATTVGDIVVPDTLFWTANTALTLDSARNIALNGAINLSFNNPPFVVPGGTLNLAARGSGAVGGGMIASTGEIYIGLFNLTNGNWMQNTATLPAFQAIDFRFTQSNATFLRAAGGDGSVTTPYRITDVYGLQGMASSNQLGRNFVLANTIDASGTANWNTNTGFASIGRTTAFSGSLNGGLFAISGLFVNGGFSNAGLFGQSSGTLSNIMLTGVNVRGLSNVGGLVGTNSGTVSGSSVTGSVTGAAVSGSVGGLIGVMTAGAVTNSSSSAAINAAGSSAQNSAGLIGNMTDGTVTNSSASGAVFGGAFAGGLIGTMSGTASVVSSSAAGNVFSSSTTVGGLVGRMFSSTSVSNSVARGTVSGTSAVGGLVGSVSGANIAGSSATGTVTARTGSTAGGLVGTQAASGTTSSTISNSFATGAVSGLSIVGGLVGISSGSTQANTFVTNSYATGAVSGTGDNLGGLIGRGTTATIAGSYATGNVTGSSTGNSLGVGGLVGSLQAINGRTASIDLSYATGTVRSNGSNVGGLVGTQFSTGSTQTVSITNSYATGNVTTTVGSAGGGAGGLIGVQLGLNVTARNVYATGAVSAPNGALSIGGLIGQQKGGAQVSSAYATGSVTGSADVGGLIGTQLDANTSVDNVYATGRVTGDQAQSGGLIGVRGGLVSNAYYDSYSTGQGLQAIGRIDPAPIAGPVPTLAANAITAVSSNPNRAAGELSAYAASSYANLTNGASSVGGANPTGFVFLAGDGTRPFLAFEVPTAARVGATPGDLGSVRTILNSHQLQLIGYNAETLFGTYRLAGNIDLAETGRVVAGTPGSYSGMWAGTGFVSLGTNGAGLTWDGTTYRTIGTITSGTYGYSGTFDGSNFALSNLFIKRVNTNNTGLFGTVSGEIRNVFVGGSVTGGNGTGGLAGMLIGGPTTSTVGRSPVVSNATSTVNVTGLQVVGGLVGSATQRSSMLNSFASGTVNGTNTIGGLIGSANRAIVTGSASGAVTGQGYVGGLIGQQFAGTTTGFATGAVSGTIAVGGLIGVLDGTAAERGTATATQAAQAGITGPSSADRNFGRVTANGTARTTTANPD